MKGNRLLSVGKTTKCKVKHSQGHVQVIALNTDSSMYILTF